jgi:hypothetical protein
VTIQERIESYATYSSALLEQLKELSALQDQIQKTEMALLNSKTHRIRQSAEKLEASHRLKPQGGYFRPVR